MKLQNELKKCMQNGKMVSIFADEGDYDYFFTGYIQAMDETGILLSKQNYGGFPNGFVFFTQIVNFETDSPDTARHERLYRLRSLAPETFPVSGEGDLLDRILQVCYENCLFCDVYKKEEDERSCTGFISQLHENYIAMIRVDRYGKASGKVFMNRSDIFRIFIEGEYEQSIRLLYEDGQEN